MLHSDIAVLDPTERLKSLAKRSDASPHFGIILGVRMQECDATHPLALRARRERPSHRAAEPCNELPPSHSITSSVKASSFRGMVRPSAFAVLRFTTISNFV